MCYETAIGEFGIQIRKNINLVFKEVVQGEDIDFKVKKFIVNIPLIPEIRPILNKHEKSQEIMLFDIF